MVKINKFPVVILLAILMMTIISPAAVLAGENEVSERLPRFIDEEGLLTAEQAATLTAKLDEISERHQFDTVIAVVPALDYREARLYAADFFEQNGFGYGKDIDGAILLLAMENRDFGFASFGYGFEVFTPAGQEHLDKQFLPYLKKNQYFEAFMAYAEAVDDFLIKAESGVPYDQGNIPKSASEIKKYRLIGAAAALVLALLIAFVVTAVWRGQLTSVRKENFANEYVRRDSMVLRGQRDIFLHRSVKKVRRADNNSRSGGGGSFRSSSGRSATGHSGKF